MPLLNEIDYLFQVAQGGSLSVAKKEGITLEGLISSMLFSSIWCVFQLIAYYYLKQIYPEFYKNSKRVKVIPFLMSPLKKQNDIADLLDVEKYRKYGLEVYFLLRYIYSIIYYFVGMLLVCIPILVPYNWANRGNRRGMDALAMEKIGYVHILVALVLIMWTEYVVRTENAFKKELARRVADRWGERSIVIEGTIDDVTRSVVAWVGMGAITKIDSLKEQNDELNWVVREIKKYKQEIDRCGEDKVQTWMYLPVWNDIVIRGISKKVYRGAFLIQEFERLMEQKPIISRYCIVKFGARQQAEIVAKHLHVPIGTQLPQKQSCEYFFWKWVSPILATLLTVFWVVPVACVAVLAQVPFLSRWIPGGKWLHWTESFPVVAFAQWVLPTMVLTFLTEAAVGVLQRLAGRDSNVERVQKWIFRFLLFQLGMVVSVSAGAVGTIRGFLTSPTEVATTVADDVTRAGTFFAGFFAMKGMAMVGGQILRLGDLLFYIWRKHRTKTKTKTNKLFNKTTESLLSQRYRALSIASLQATMAAHAAVGVLYTFVAPITGLFVIFHFVCAWTAYAHTPPPVFNATSSTGEIPYTQMGGLRVGAWAVVGVLVLLIIE